MNLQDVEVGDTVVRLMGGSVEMPLVVSKVDDQFVYCGDYTFEREHGCEYDPDLQWGSPWRATGSIITKVVKKDEEPSVPSRSSASPSM